MAIRATTTISSTSVKPRCRAFTNIERPRVSLPGTDLGILAFAADHAVGAEAVDVDLALDAGIGVLIRTTPRVVGQLVDVRLPVRRDRVHGGLGCQRLQALLAARVA